MGFRDDDLAAHARIDALEREVEELKREKAELEQGGKVDKSVRNVGGRGLFRGALFMCTLAVALACFAAYAYAERMGGDDVGHGFTFLSVFLFAGSLPLFMLSRLLMVVPAGKMLVLQGRSSRGADGKMRPYRVVREGRTMRVPVLEIASELTARPMKTDVKVDGVFTKSNERVDIEARASVAVAEGPAEHNAIERFLGREDEEIVQVARETLEGTLRNVVAYLTPEELRALPDELAARVVEEAEEDFARMGLNLESLHILQVG